MYVCPLNRDIYTYIYIYKVHPRTVLLVSAARPSINLTFSCKVFYSTFFLCKTDLQSSNYLKNRRGYAFPDYDRFCPPFGNEIPLTINHGREMSTISGNDRRICTQVLFRIAILQSQKAIALETSIENL